MVKLHLYVAGEDDESRALHRNLVAAIAANLPEGAWDLEVVDVVRTPEKALENDVFATPMLLREKPEPVIKLIGHIANAQRILAILQSTGEEGQTVVV